MWNIPASYQLKLYSEMQFKKKVHLWSFLAPLLKITPCVRSPFGGDEHRSAPHPETFQNFPRKKRGVEEHHHFICSHRFSKIPPSYFQKKRMVPRALATRPIIPTLHCSHKHEKCGWRSAMSRLTGETSGSFRRGRCSKTRLSLVTLS